MKAKTTNITKDTLGQIPKYYTLLGVFLFLVTIIILVFTFLLLFC